MKKHLRFVLLCLLLMVVVLGCNPPGSSTPSGATTPYFLYVANSDANTVSAYSIGSNGALKELTSLGSPFTTGANPSAVAVSPNGSFLYVASNLLSYHGGIVSAYSIGSNGALTELTSLGSPYTAGANPCAVAIATVTSP